MRFAVIGLLAFAAAPALAADSPPFSALEKEMIGYLDTIRPELVAVNQDIWTYAEIGLEEHRSAARLIGLLEKAGFTVKKGVSNMPTAFVAEYGKGKPIVGILAEYDALPELSQEAIGTRRPAAGRTTGHGCGHSALGTAAVAAALAVKQVHEKYKLPGTIRVYGTPAEETLIGKVYMTLDGQFNDLDVCLHWHPGSRNSIWYGSSKALISAKFTFSGLPAHASGSPDRGRSALDAVELMNIGVNYMREHVKESSRIHYVITNGGGQPNVVPASATVWYFVRANTHEDCVANFEWIKEIADGAARMTRTKFAVQIDTDCHEIIPNYALSKLIHRNLTRVGPPPFDDADRLLARQLREPLRSGFGLRETKELHDTIGPLPEKPLPPDGGSTDVGDVSWHVPTSGLGVACFALESPGHSWQNVAAIGSPIGHKGMLVAAKVLALTTAELLRNPKEVQDARDEFAKIMKGRRYTTIIPEGQKAPKSIR